MFKSRVGPVLGVLLVLTVGSVFAGNSVLTVKASRMLDVESGKVRQKAATRAGVASIEHGSMLDDEAIALMKEKGTYLVPTTYLGEAIDMSALPSQLRTKAEFVMPLAQASLEKAISAGVKIAFGTDAAVYPHGQNAKEFYSLVKRGMSNLEAVRSATLYAADLLGVEDRGVIESGRLADLIAVEEDPLENIRSLEDVHFVMLGGHIVKNRLRE
jgi:imidazolonepropionase-like amidohydrolase